MVFLSHVIFIYALAQIVPKLLLEILNSIFQDGAVNADLILNREQFEWWAFKDVNPPNISKFCGGLTGPMAIIISEETPPRKLAMSFFLQI